MPVLAAHTLHPFICVFGFLTNTICRKYLYHCVTSASCSAPLPTRGHPAGLRAPPGAIPHQPGVESSRIPARIVRAFCLSDPYQRPSQLAILTQAMPTLSDYLHSIDARNEVRMKKLETELKAAIDYNYGAKVLSRPTYAQPTTPYPGHPNRENSTKASCRAI